MFVLRQLGRRLGAHQVLRLLSFMRALAAWPIIGQTKGYEEALWA